MSKTTVFFIGAVVGILIPMLLDLSLFGTITPCHTVSHYEDGSSVQKCEVRN